MATGQLKQRLKRSRQADLIVNNLIILPIRIENEFSVLLPLEIQRAGQAYVVFKNNKSISSQMQNPAV